jgi:hypothetical protein
MVDDVVLQDFYEDREHLANGLERRLNRMVA